MIQLLLLLAWTSTGALLALRMTPASSGPAEFRAGWVPVAVFLGPLWAAVAAERRGSGVDSVVVPVSVKEPSPSDEFVVVPVPSDRTLQLVGAGKR